MQATGQFGDESADHRRVGTGQIGHLKDQVARIVFGRIREFLDPFFRQFVMGTRHGQPDGNASEVFDQCQTEHDRNGPEFAQRQDGFALIGRNEMGKTVGVDMAVTVRDDFQRQFINPGDGTHCLAG